MSIFLAVLKYMLTFAVDKTLFYKGGLTMELQKVNISGERLIPSGAHRDDISVRRLGIAKVLWRKLNVEVPASEVIANGVNTYKG